MLSEGRVILYFAQFRAITVVSFSLISNVFNRSSSAVSDILYHRSLVEFEKEPLSSRFRDSPRNVAS